MPRTSGPKYQFNTVEHFYKFRDSSNTWWWRCTCNAECWDWHFKSLGALQRHQRTGGRPCCPVDPSYVPDVHPATVYVDEIGLRVLSSRATGPTVQPQAPPIVGNLSPLPLNTVQDELGPPGEDFLDDEWPGYHSAEDISGKSCDEQALPWLRSSCLTRGRSCLKRTTSRCWSGRLRLRP
jgi:hypothetical protein